MINRSFFLFSAAIFLFGNIARSIASDSISTCTQHTPIELEPALLNHSYEIASVCFLGVGCGNDGNFNKSGDDYEIDSIQQCKQEGFIHSVSNCSLPNYLERPCPYNSNYYLDCSEDIPRACKEAGYTQSSQCLNGTKLKKTPRCLWDNDYGICCKESCPTNTSLICTGAIVGNDGCGYDCKQCCSTSCPSGSYEHRTGSGQCGGASTRDGCNTKTCYYPYYSCPCYPSCSEKATSCPPDYYLYEYSDGCGGTCSSCDCGTSWQGLGDWTENCSAPLWMCKGQYLCETESLINCHGESLGTRSNCVCYSNWKRTC